MDVKRALEESGFVYKKSLGQNYLFDEGLLSRIAAATDITDKCVIEIGAGAGTLTRFLSKRAKKVFAFEIDGDAVGLLEKNTRDCPNVCVLCENPLSLGADGLKKIVGDNDFVCVSNLPYNITTEVVTLLCEVADSFTLLLQKEAAERFTGEGCALGYLLRALGIVNIAFTVPKEAFTPPPEVDGAVMTFTRNKTASDFVGLKKYLSVCFANKRKTLANNFKSAYNISKDAAIKAFEKCGIKPQARAEEVNVESLVSLGVSLGILQPLKQVNQF